MILVQNIIRIDSVESTRELKYFLHPPRIIWINKSTRFVPEFVGGQLAQLVELDLLGEDIERNVDRASKEGRFRSKKYSLRSGSKYRIRLCGSPRSVSGNWFSVRSCVSNRSPLTCRDHVNRKLSLLFGGNRNIREFEILEYSSIRISSNTSNSNLHPK